MRRLHLFEWEDQPWLPRVFRDFITDHLRYSHNEPLREPVNKEIAGRLKAILEETGTCRIIDLCAGAGGPLGSVVPILTRDLDCPVDVLLTDLFPNLSALERVPRDSRDRMRLHPTPTNAFDVPAELQGLRTVFTAIHHFHPEQVRRILQDAADKGAPIAVFEPLERSWRFLLLLGVGSLVRGFTHTPRVGPMTWQRFLFTYLLPVAPLLFAWDGAVSVLRSYTAGELSSIAAGVRATGYRFEVGQFDVDGPFGGMPTVFVAGHKENALAHAGQGV